MPSNLVSLVMQYLTPDLIARIASALGLDRSLTDRAVAAVVPALLGGFTKLAASPDGARKLYDTVSSQPPGMVNSLANALSGSGQRTLAENGLNIVSSLFGGSATQTLASAVSRYIGADQGSASSLLGMLAPVVTGALAKETTASNLDAGGLAQMLKSQQSNIQAALPGGFADLLRGSGLLGDITGQAGRAASSAAQTASISAQRAAAQAAASASSMRWAYWAIPVLIALGAIWWLVGDRMAPSTTQTAEQQTPASPQPMARETTGSRTSTGTMSSDDLTTRMSQAVASLSSFPGGSDIANETTTALNTLKGSLSGIADTASAQSALPKLQEAQAEIDKVRGQTAQLPTGGRVALANLIAMNLPAINAQLDRILAIPGVASILKQPIDALRANLDTLSRAPA